VKARKKREKSVARATRGVTFDTGVLIGLERRHASALALLKACMLSRATITIPSSVVAEWWRGSHRTVLESGIVEPLTSELAEAAGLLLAAAGGKNSVDAVVVASAARRGDIVATGDLDDVRQLARGLKNVTVVSI
jgi:predicted nucleic acid-binding protein